MARAAISKSWWDYMALAILMVEVEQALHPEWSRDRIRKKAAVNPKYAKKLQNRLFDPNNAPQELREMMSDWSYRNIRDARSAEKIAEEIATEVARDRKAPIL